MTSDMGGVTGVTGDVRTGFRRGRWEGGEREVEMSVGVWRECECGSFLFFYSDEGKRGIVRFCVFRDVCDMQKRQHGLS